MCFRVKEVRYAISMTGKGRVTGFNAILKKFWKSINNTSTKWLIKLFNVILKITKMLGE